MAKIYPRGGAGVTFYILGVVLAVVLGFFIWLWLRQRPVAPVHTAKPQSSEILPLVPRSKFSPGIRASASLPA